MNHRGSQMFFKIIVVALFHFICVHAFAITAVKLGQLPSSLREASGVDFTGGSSYWAHNDGYGDNKLYKVGSTAVFSHSITVTGSINKDWEDITHDANRTYMFIGDFGNNGNNRTDLRILRIQYPSNVSGSTVAASIIKFSYPDQLRFPSPWLNFDAEGFFHRNGKLYIFTKGDGNATGYTKLYTVPDVPGNYVATLIDSFPVNCRITSAAISPDGLKVVLISNTKIFLFKNFSGTNIFNGQCTKITIDGSYTQKEGVTFCSNSKICLVDEKGSASNNLYAVDLTSYLISPRFEEDVIVESDNRPELSVYPNPSSDYAILNCKEDAGNAEILIADLSGKIVRQYRVSGAGKEIRLETEELLSGLYMVILITENNKRNSLLLSISH